MTPFFSQQGPARKKRKSKPLEFNFPSEKFYDEESPSNLNKEYHLVSRISDIVRKILLDFQVSVFPVFLPNLELIQ